MSPRAAACEPLTLDQLGWGGEARAASSAAAGSMDSTLGTLIERLWEGLWAGGSPCPLCEEGRLELHNGSGHCTRCGSVLG